MDITIGIPAYNEEKSIARSVQSALDSRPTAREVLVIASGCTDDTANIVKKMQKTNKRIILIEEKVRRGKGSALNIIFKKARGKIIVMTDGDLTFPKNSIGELISKFKGKIGAVSGRPQYFAHGALFDWWGKFASECASRQRIARNESGYHAISGYLYAIKKGIVRQIPIGVKSEDAYVGEMVMQAGYKIAYAEKAIVWVGYAENMRDYIVQKVRTHFGHLEVFKKAGAKNPIQSARMASSLRGEIGEYFKVANVMIKTPSQLAYFLLYISIEFMVWIMAFLKFYLKGEEEWKQIQSTKK